MSRRRAVGDVGIPLGFPRAVGGAGVKILAYCLMLNHIHLVCVPEAEDSLAACLMRTHGRYSQYLNARRQRSGHLWQNRFYSCPLEERHLWTALRYVELNPVRAGLVAKAEEYEYSSVALHLGFKQSDRLLDLVFWRESGAAETWPESLQIDENEEERRRLRKATYGGMPLGSEEFVELCKLKVEARERESEVFRLAPIF